MSPAMLTLVAAVEVYDLATDGLEMVDWLSVLLLLMVLALARGFWKD